MFRSLFASSVALIAFLATVTTAASQEPPRSGTYQIYSGSYREVGGIAGGAVYPLPRSWESFVSLVVGTATNAADLTILDTNQGKAFLRLTNGTVSGNTIQFHYATRYPQFPGWPAWLDYTVTNGAGHLWISGSITSPPPGPDLPYVFEHRDVRAAFMPVLSILPASPVEVRWTSASNQNYQLQHQPGFTQRAWTNLGGPVQGNGITNYVEDSMAPMQLQRFYRILTLP